MDTVAPRPQMSDRDRTVTMIGILTAMLLAALEQRRDGGRRQQQAVTITADIADYPARHCRRDDRLIERRQQHGGQDADHRDRTTAPDRHKLAALDQSIVAPAMPTIGGTLGNPQYLPWIVTAYLLAATAVAPLYGRVSDIYGRRPTLYAALGLFLLGSVIAALSPNLFTLIGARAVQGIGGGGLFALSQILIGDMLPPRERGRYSAWISGMWAVAGIAGPLLGGTLAEFYWPSIFWLNLPLGVPWRCSSSAIRN